MIETFHICSGRSVRIECHFCYDDYFSNICVTVVCGRYMSVTTSYLLIK